MSGPADWVRAAIDRGSLAEPLRSAVAREMSLRPVTGEVVPVPIAPVVTDAPRAVIFVPEAAGYRAPRGEVDRDPQLTLALWWNACHTRCQDRGYVLAGTVYHGSDAWRMLAAGRADVIVVAFLEHALAALPVEVATLTDSRASATARDRPRFTR